ncbi:Predicted oxidoreductase [Onishia taeanensis]|uniref:Predicted oxidoreductase n=1 Tax=Onishia taeanensis TaxID=284577 RepID=A0A1G7S8F7_9GAMM|nr:aldo/keto reductase [Halomonas taeanensis]SDG19212.1 Predicted oxidoreductase [Halomonas taeanensis]
MTSSTTTSSPLPERVLGQGLRVSSMGYGAMGLSEFYGHTEEASALAILHEVVESGVTLIDTADVYGRGHNERLIGQLLASPNASRELGNLKVATKCGIDRPADASYARSINNRPEYIRACCEASLTRLGVEQLDLYYLHRVDPEADITETMGVMKQLVEEGKVAHVGLCEVSASTLKRAHAVHPLTALQTEYSLWSRDIEAEILPAVEALDIGLVAYSPLGRGFLTGRIASTQDLADDDFRRHNPRFQDENLAHNLELLKSVEAVAQRHSATPGQVALAWLLGKYSRLVPIPGTRRSRYLKENLAALSLRLEAQEVAELQAVMQPERIHGQRYTAEGMKGVNT